MRSTHVRSAGARLSLAAAAAATLAAAWGCSLNTGPGSMPTVAHIVAGGTSPVPLRLIVSTNFYEVKSQDGTTLSEVYNSADTTNIDLPYDARVNLTDLGAISVRVQNPAAQSASVRLQVGLDNGQGYDNTATIANGQELSYVYVYLQPTFH